MEMESSVRVIKFDFERLKERVFYGCKYTPLYEKGIKETQNRAMETTSVLLLFPILVV